MSFLDLSDLGLNTNPTDLANLAIGFLEAQIPGYQPSPGNLEVIQAEALSLIAADVAQAAMVVPSAIWRAFGTKLVGVPYLNGASAQTQVAFTTVDTAGYSIPAGTSVSLNSFGFFTQAALTIPPGSNTGAVTVAAAATGKFYNGAYTPAALVTQLNFISGVAVLTPAYGGVDQEDDVTYQNRLVSELSLQAPRPITATDYQTMALSFPPAAGTDQQEIGRATAIDGYNPASTVFTANTTSTSSTLASVSLFTGISAGTSTQPGSIITGAGIPTGTTVVSVNTGANTLVMSNNATATATGVSLSSQGSYGNPRMVGLWVALADGTAPNADTLAAVQAWFQSYREVNFIVNVMAPTYTTVYTAAAIHPYPNVNAASVQAAVQAAQLAFLSPLTWGQPQFGDRPNWFNEPYVRYDKLIAVIQNVSGVDFVQAGSVKLGLAASPTGTTDLVLPGPVPVPISTTSSVPLPTLV